jgi:hypothetical protein
MDILPFSGPAPCWPNWRASCSAVLSSLMAQSGHFAAESPCPLCGVKRTSRGHERMFAFDREQTSRSTLIQSRINRPLGEGERTLVHPRCRPRRTRPALNAWSRWLLRRHRPLGGPLGLRFDTHTQQTRTLLTRVGPPSASLTRGPVAPAPLNADETGSKLKGPRASAVLNIARGSAGRYPARNTDARATGVLPCHRYSGGMDATAHIHRGAGRRCGVAGGGSRSRC